MENTFALDAFKESLKACQNALMSNSEISKSLEQFIEAVKFIEHPALSSSIESIRKAFLDMNVSTPNSVRAAAEALQAMCDYVSPQNRNADKLSAPEAPAKRKQNFFDKLEAVAEKYKCSLPLLVSLIALLSSTVFGVLSLQSQNSDTSEELQLRQIEVDRAQVEQTEELSKAINRFCDIAESSQDSFDELFESLHEFIGIAQDATDGIRESADDPAEPTDIQKQEPLTD